MSDFASAAMIRVLVQGLRDLGLDPGPDLQPPAGARVDLALKRDVVSTAVRQGGLACLPLLGRGLHRLAHEPTHQALAAARDGLDLFERWQRLERYIHSRHRCHVLHGGVGQARLQHTSLAAGAPPSAAEDFVVLGVLAALLEAIGATSVQVQVDGVAAFPSPDGTGLAALAQRGATARWDFHWQEPAARARPPDDATTSRELGADATWPEAARAAYRLLLRDLARPPALPDLAATLGRPARTLQRQLAAAGLGYARLLAEARCRAGAWRLLHTADPIAEIGFLAGFADQSHFTRELQRRVGLPPAAYRQAFAVRTRAARAGPG